VRQGLIRAFRVHGRRFARLFDDHPEGLTSLHQDSSMPFQVVQKAIQDLSSVFRCSTRTLFSATFFHERKAPAASCQVDLFYRHRFPPLSGGSGVLLAGLVRGLLEFRPLRPIVLLAQGFAKGREVAYSAVQGLLARAIPFWAAHEFGFVLGFLKK
jgi:hypothetical protein